MYSELPITSVLVFDPILTHIDKLFQHLIDDQHKRLKVFDYEYQELNKKLEWSWYGVSEEDWKILERNIENEKRIIEPYLKEERGKLTQLYSDQRKFISENSQYTVSYHVDLLDYMDSILKKSFNRSRKISKREKINELIEFVKKYFETNTILNKEQNILFSKLVDEIKTAFQNHNNEKSAGKIVELTDKIEGYREINSALSSQLEELKKLAVETITNIDNSVELVTNKLDLVLDNQKKDKKSFEELILDGSIHPKSSLFLNVYTLLGRLVFEPIEPNTFVNIFQGHASSTKLKIKPRNIQNVYFILSELSIHLKNITDKSSFWLRHVISFIQWSDNASVELILERIHKKKSNVEKEISEKVLNLIQVDYEKFKNN